MRVVVLIVFFLGIVTIGLAQGEPEACPVMVQQALEMLDETCYGLGRNSACYGNHDITATFTTPVEEGYFSKPADTSPLMTLSSLQTAPLDIAGQRWGIALMNVQANVPDTLPGQGVVFLLMGDARIENHANPNKLKNQQITVTTSQQANLRFEPHLESAVLGSIPNGTSLVADKRTRDELWVRVAYDNLTGWLHRSVFTTSQNVNTLPRPGRLMSPMQAFQFTTGVGQANCREANGALLIQGPNNVTVDIRVNGARISIGSTILLNYDNNGYLEVSVLSGKAKVDGLSIPAGFSVSAPVDTQGNVAGKFGQVTRMSGHRLDELRLYSQIPSRLMHYTINLPTSHELSLLEELFKSHPVFENHPAVSPPRGVVKPKPPKRGGRDNNNNRGSSRGSRSS